MAANTHWTFKDEYTLVKMYSVGIEEALIAKFFDRSERAVRDRRAKILNTSVSDRFSSHYEVMHVSRALEEYFKDKATARDKKLRSLLRDD